MICCQDGADPEENHQDHPGSERIEPLGEFGIDEDGQQSTRAFRPNHRAEDARHHQADHCAGGDRHEQDAERPKNDLIDLTLRGGEDQACEGAGHEDPDPGSKDEQQLVAEHRAEPADEVHRLCVVWIDIVRGPVGPVVTDQRGRREHPYPSQHQPEQVMPGGCAILRSLRHGACSFCHNNLKRS